MHDACSPTGGRPCHDVNGDELSSCLFDGRVEDVAARLTLGPLLCPPYAHALQHELHVLSVEVKDGEVSVGLRLCLRPARPAMFICGTVVSDAATQCMHGMRLVCVPDLHAQLVAGP